MKELSEKEKLGKIASDAHRSLDDHKKGQHYAAFYGERYYWEKILNVFADSIDSDVHSVEFSFLTYKNGWYFGLSKEKGSINCCSQICIFSTYYPVSSCDLERFLVWWGQW